MSLPASAKGRQEDVGRIVDDEIERCARPLRHPACDVVAAGKRAIDPVHDQGDSQPDEEHGPIALRPGQKRKQRDRRAKRRKHMDQEERMGAFQRHGDCGFKIRRFALCHRLSPVLSRPQGRVADENRNERSVCPQQGRTATRHCIAHARISQGKLKPQAVRAPRRTVQGASAPTRSGTRRSHAGSRGGRQSSQVP